MRSWFPLLLWLPLIPAVAAQTPASSQPTNCTVQGQIIQQPGGQPIGKANVRLFGTGDADTTEVTAITDAEGRFKIEDVKPGAYRVSYDRSGFVDSEKRHHGNGMLLSVEAGQDVKDLLFHMAPAAVITGRVTDLDGDPVPNVEVAAIPPHFNRNSVPAVAGGTTNDLGEYRIGGLSPNHYLVEALPLRQLSGALESAKAGGKMPTVYGVTYYPGTTDKSQASPLVLRPGDDVPVNIRLAPVRFFHVRGEVTNLPTGTTDATVVLRPLEDYSMAAIENWPLDKDGKFDIRGVLPGSFGVLLVFGSGLSPTVMRGDQTVQVSSADVDGLRISPVPNGQVRGRFRMDNGQKTDWSSVHVSLYSNRPAPPLGSYTSAGNGFDAMYWDDNPAHAEVGRDGSFEMQAIPADIYQVSMRSSSKSFESYYVKAVSQNGKDVSDSGVNVSDVACSLDILVGANSASVEGVVSDGDKPASDVHVVIIPDPAGRRQRHDLYQIRTTDDHGHFNLIGLGPGHYQLFAVDEDADYDEVTDPEFARAHESSAKAIKLEEGEHKSIELKLSPQVGDK
jgi:hypothetical protein